VKGVSLEKRVLIKKVKLWDYFKSQTEPFKNIVQSVAGFTKINKDKEIKGIEYYDPNGQKIDPEMVENGDELRNIYG